MSDFRKRYAPVQLADDLRKSSQAPQPQQEVPVAEVAQVEAPPEDGDSVSMRGVAHHRKIRLELWFKDGSMKSVNYSDIVLIDYSTEEGITLDLRPHFKVTIRGFALADLLRALSAERVAALREVDFFAADVISGHRKPTVTSIFFEKWKN